MNQTRTDIPAALTRVMKRHERVGNPTRWAKLAGLPRQTVADAVRGANTTLETLQKMAAGAGMTLAELLEYGDEGWESRTAARMLLRSMTVEEIEALSVLLGKRSATPPDPGEPASS